MYYFSIYLSLFSILVAGIFYYKNKSSFLSSLFFSLSVIAVSLLNFFYFASNKLSGHGINEAVLYHLSTGLEGTGISGYQYLLAIFVILIVFTIIFLWFVFKKSQTQKSFSKISRSISFLLIILALFLSPATPDLYKLFSLYYKPFNFLAVLANSSQKEQTIGEKGFTELYGEIPVQKIGENKNFVFIYLEGLEETYSNENAFPGLTKNLNKLKEKSTYFTNLEQIDGTDFTIAGIVSSLCGTPLFSLSPGNTMSGVDKYLPSATCLSDVLKKDGYFLSYYGGADLNFAGKGLFLKTHSFDEVNGSAELLPSIENQQYQNPWGLYDDSLLDLVYNHFLSLSSLNQKFGLFTLTLDTHPPEGYPSKNCDSLKYGDGKNKMLNTIFCSDYMVGKFVDKILASPYAKNTVIVIANDHLAIENIATEQLNKQKRYNRLMIISPDSLKSEKISSLGTSIDIASTILPFIGYEGDIGLGRNLLDNSQQEETKLIRENLQEKWRDNILALWNFPKIEKSLVIDTTAKNIEINGRKFKIPIMIEISPNMQTNLRFTFDVPENSSFVSLLKKQGPYGPFLLIDKCTEIQKIEPNTKEGNFCLLASRGTDYSVFPLEDITTLSVEDIKNMTGLIASKN